MKIVIVLSALLVTTYALDNKSRPPGCNDPVYACQDLATARLCGVVSDCIHDIWSTMRAPDDNNEICDICKEMVKEARDQLLSNETQEEIKEVFEGSCEYLEIKIIVNECKKIFDDLIPEIIEMLASRMDPNTVCTLAGLCNNAVLKDLSVLDKLVVLDVIPAIKTGICNGCEIVFSLAKSTFTNIPEDTVKNFLLKQCKQYPPVFTKCDMLVKQYLPVVYNFAENMDPAVMCRHIGVCNESFEITKLLSNCGDELTCEFCESLILYLREIILTNTTKEEFRTALLNMCSIMGDFSAECKQLVNEYFDMLYDFIDKNLDPEKVCTALGLCQSGEKSIVPMVQIRPIHNMWNGKHPNRKDISSSKEIEKTYPDIFPAVKVYPAKMIQKKNYIPNKEISNEIRDEQPQQLPIERMLHPLLSLKRDTDCAFSKAIMYFLEKDLKARNSKAITAALDKVCYTWLPGYMKECKQLVENNYYKIVELLVHGVNFTEVPGYLGLCHDVKQVAVKVIPPVKANNGITCDLCMQVMDYLKKELKDKKSEEEIREVLDKVCSYLPQSISQQCQQFVNEYTDTIVSLLLQEIDPSKICQAIGLCPQISAVQENDFECDLCKAIMAYVKSKLSEPKVEDDIRKALDEVCSILPKSWASACENFVNQYTDLIITLILEEVDPDGICSMLGICPGKVGETKSIKSSADCEICTYIMNYLENELKDKTVESDIRKALDSVCSFLPKSYALRCQQFVDKYTEKIITLLVQNVSPTTLCSLFQECPSQHIACLFCEWSLHFIQEQLMSNHTETEIKQMVEKLCSYLPKDIALQCNAFIEEYGDAFIVLIAQQLDPSIICPLFNVCPSKSLPKELPVAPLNDVKLSGCDICKAVVDAIDALLANAKIVNDVVSFAAEICSVFSGSAKQECNSIVHIYGPFIVHMIGSLENAQQVCQTFDICSRVAGNVELLGGSDCSRGPVYWCKSHAHAAACKQEMYCKQEVWKN